MTSQTIALTTEIQQYLLATSLREPDVLQQLRLRTASLPQGGMHISPDQGQLMALLVKLMQAKKILELGVFTGYSTLWLAQALPENGSLVACEIADTWLELAREYWQQAGVAAKIELRIGPALQTLSNLLATGEENSFDLVFIDADKTHQAEYYELALQLVRVGGLILLDNCLWQGKVADPTVMDNRTQRIRKLNAKLKHDARVDSSMLAVGDGLWLLRKR